MIDTPSRFCQLDNDNVPYLRHLTRGEPDGSIAIQRCPADNGAPEGNRDLRSTKRYQRVAALFTLVLAGLLLTSPSTLAANDLLNLGFEDGALDGNPVNWTVMSSADSVKVVDTEGPSEFQTYADMGNVTVSPYQGNLMLRLGTPRRNSQNQPPGLNWVAQTYSSTDSTLEIAFRLFSWEHRGRDTFRIDVRDGNQSVGDLAAPVQIKRSNGSVMHTCNDIPCDFSIDAGSSGQFINTGWLTLQIINLPSDGRNLTVWEKAYGTIDSSHPTWAYFDNVNSPPVAKFSFECIGEGDVCLFFDLSYDPDPGDAITSRTWVIDGRTFTSQNPFFIFPDEGNFTASLRVTDTSGTEAIVSDGSAATDGDLVPDLVVQNEDPLVNALNVEALAGDDFRLIGRHIDPGSADAHSAQWSINGNPAATVEEENDPLLSSGLISGKLTATSNLNGTLTVNDGDGGSASDNFNVTVVPDTPASRTRYEPNDTTLDPQNPPPILKSDGAYLSFIQEAGDVDIYEVRTAGGAPVKPGGELLVSLSALHADVDLAVLSKLPTGASAQWSDFGWGRAGWGRAGFSEFDSTILGWGRAGWGRAGWGRAGNSQVGLSTFNNSGVSWADIGWGRAGLSQSGFLAGGNDVTPLDVELEELGLGSIGGKDLQVADFSANRGLDDESAWARSATAGTSFYVAVFKSDGEESLTPYTLSVETIEPPDLEVNLGPLCDGSPLVTTGATPISTILHDYDDPNTPENDPAKAVFVTQEQRMRVTYSLDNAGWNDLLGDVVAVAQLPQVGADVLSVASTYFDDADRHPCLVEAANSVTTQIRDDLNAMYPNVEHRVIVGDGSIIPFRRVLDYTIIGNEKNYLMDAFVKPGSPEFAAILQGYFLTDDYYGDPTGNPWQGDEAYVPTIGIGRLVETPAEIQGQLQVAFDSNLQLDVATGSTFGYDFFQDGAESIGDSLDAGLAGPVHREINDAWTADDMRCLFLGEGAGPDCGVRDVASPVGHSTHYAILSALGFENDDFTNFVSNDDVANAGDVVAALKNTLVFTMGCHSGFSSPDAASQGPDAGTGIDPALDLPQAMARQFAVYVASNGYGIGDDAGVAGHEKLMTLFPNELLAGGVTVGEALKDAKQSYLGGLATTTVYDLKVSMETTLYGLPMYEVNPASSMSLLAMPVVESGVPAGNFTLTTVDAGSTVPTVTTTHQLESFTNALGTKYTLDGEAQGAPGRALQPTFSGDADERHPYTGAPPPIHGLRVTGATYTDIPDTDAVFSTPTNTWLSGVVEAQQCQAGWSPSDVAQINSFQRGNDLTQTLVVVAGQFQCTSGDALTVTGVERLYSSLSIEIMRCSSTALNGPVLNDLEARNLGDGSVEVRVDASDDTGLRQIDVLRVDEGSIVPFSQTFSVPLPTSGVFNINVPNVEETTNLLVQLEDADCNVTVDTHKSAGLSLLNVDAGPDVGLTPPFNATLSATIPDFASVDEPVWFVWEFSDGGFTDGVLAPAELQTHPVVINPDGSATFTLQHKFTTPVLADLAASIEVHDSAGGVGVDDVAFFCDPPEGGPVLDGDCDLVLDSQEGPCGADESDIALRPERVDGVFAGMSEDGDTDVDEALPAGATAYDCDGDGYTGAAENHVYSYFGQLNGDQKTCQEYDTAFPDPMQNSTPSKRWPSDLSAVPYPDSRNRITLHDFTSFLAPIHYFNSNVGIRPGDVRWDLVPGKGIYETDINLNDLTALLAGASGSPAMLGGKRAFGGAECSWPP